jgi:hypothetical protein
MQVQPLIIGGMGRGIVTADAEPTTDSKDAIVTAIIGTTFRSKVFIIFS